MFWVGHMPWAQVLLAEGLLVGVLWGVFLWERGVKGTDADILLPELNSTHN
jgi:hypothetical protein